MLFRSVVPEVRQGVSRAGESLSLSLPPLLLFVSPGQPPPTVVQRLVVSEVARLKAATVPQSRSCDGPVRI